MTNEPLKEKSRPPHPRSWFVRTISSVRSKVSGYRSALSQPVPRLVIALAALSFIAVALFFFSSKAYEHMSPWALKIAAIAKWVVTVVVALIAVWVLLESRKSDSARTLRIVSVVTIILTLFLKLGLEPPPKFSVQELRELKQFNAEFDGVKITPDLEKIAEGVELSNETDPLKLAQSKLARNKLEEALMLFDKSLVEMKTMETVIADTHFYRAVTLSRLNRDEEAIAEADLAHAILPRMSLASFMKCKSLRRLHRFDEALFFCNQAISEDPLNGWAWGEKGAVLFDMGLRERDRKPNLYEESIAASDVCIKLLPKHPSPWSNKAASLRRLKRPYEAVEAANRALTLQPDFADALLNKATALKDLGRLDEAIVIYQGMTHKSPYDPEAWNNLGDSFEISKDFAKALEAYSVAAQLRPNLEDAWYNKGHMLNLLGRYSEAASALGRAVELNSNDNEAFYEQAIAFLHLGKRTEAVKSLDKAISLNPKFKEAVALRNRIRRGK